MPAKKLHKIINNIEYKHCCKCNEWKTLDKFDKGKNRADGLSPYCKECRCNEYKIKILNRPVKERGKIHIFVNGLELKQCSTCKQWKALDRFNNDKKTKDGLAHICKKCRKEEYDKNKGENKRIKYHKLINRIEYKHCSSCNQWKELNEFNNDKNRRDGLYAICKECHNKNQMERYRNNIEYYRLISREKNRKRREEIKKNKRKIYKILYRTINGLKYKKCNECKEWKLLNEFYHNKNKRGNLDYKCIECTKKYQNNYYIRNIILMRENQKLRNKKYRLANKEKVRILTHIRLSRLKNLSHTLTSEQWEETKLFFSNNSECYCVYCGGKPEKITQDHIIPVIQNGGYDQDNIVPCCRSCNSSKNGNNMEEWYKKQTFYDENKLKLIYNYILICKIKKYVNKLKESLVGLL